MAMVLALWRTTSGETFSRKSSRYSHDLWHSERMHTNTATHSISQYGRLDDERCGRFVWALAPWMGLGQKKPWNELSSIFREPFSRHRA